MSRGAREDAGVHAMEGRLDKSVDELMALRFGGASVAENIDSAIADGRLVAGEDGTLSLPETPAAPGWALLTNAPPPGCNFKFQILFDAVYARGAVPQGCASCYKVKADLRTLRELVAAWVIARHLPFCSKWGLDVDNGYSQAIYAGYFYTSSLEEARALYWTTRAAFDKDPKLGPGIAIAIKRGCSKYEATLGPSDTYTFTADQADLETYIKSRYRKAPPREAPHPLAQLPSWIDFAFRIGDDTYRDFTGGQRLRPKMISYDPGDPPNRAE